MHSRPFLISLAMSAVVVDGIACTPSTTPKPKDKTVIAPVAPKAGGPQPESPARWVMRASNQWRPAAKLVSGNSTLFAGKGGERWLAPKGGARLSHAAKLLPEDI